MQPAGITYMASLLQVKIMEKKTHHSLRASSSPGLFIISRHGNTWSLLPMFCSLAKLKTAAYLQGSQTRRLLSPGNGTYQEQSWWKSHPKAVCRALTAKCKFSLPHSITCRNRQLLSSSCRTGWSHCHCTVQTPPLFNDAEKQPEDAVVTSMLRCKDWIQTGSAQIMLSK